MIDISARLALFLLDTTGSIWGRWRGTMPVAEQRERFGRVLWGRKRVVIDGLDERVTYQRSVCFGLDFELIEARWVELDYGATI